MIFPIALIILFINYLRVINIFGYRIIFYSIKIFLMTSIMLIILPLSTFLILKISRKKISRLVRKKIFACVKKNKSYK